MRDPCPRQSAFMLVAVLGGHDNAEFRQGAGIRVERHRKLRGRTRRMRRLARTCRDASVISLESGGSRDPLPAGPFTVAAPRLA